MHIKDAICPLVYICRILTRMLIVIVTVLLYSLRVDTDAATETSRFHFHFKQGTMDEVQIFNDY
jgi:hypothetical protein